VTPAAPAADRRAIVLALDGASPALLRAWAADGTLPNLRELMRRGVVADTRNIEGFYVGSTWPSLYTGVTPARHGFHYQLQIAPGSYRLHYVPDGRIAKSPAFWEVMSKAGRRVAILDVPLSQVREPVNGIQVVEWGAHDAMCGFATSPPGLAADILARYGPHPGGTSCDGRRTDAREYIEFRDRLIRGVERKLELTLDVMQRERWDFLMQVFTETHCVGHQCWHLHDRAHPAFDAAIAGRSGDPLRAVYRAADEAIGRLAATAGDATVVVMTAHGMSFWYGAHFLLREILFRLGVAQRPEPSRAARLRAGLLAPPRAVWQRLPEGLRRPMRRVRDAVTPRASGAGGAPSIGVDTARSACFALMNGMTVSGIRLNIAGREPQGMLARGAQVAEFSQRLAEDLLAIVDERTGRPLVQRILITRELYAGPELDALPDLLVEWSDAVATGSTSVGTGAAARVAVHSPRTGRIEGENRFGRTGEHRAAGLLVAVGPGLAPGALDRSIPLLDLAATFCAMVGVPLEGSDGRPVTDLLA
jgi:predicted AlkP superfamily phosphohydrolase/phosphomutase